MKAIFYSLMVIMLLSSATCRKPPRGPQLEDRLLGEWKYIGKSGGYAGKHEKADPKLNHILQFKNGFRYQQKINNQVSEQGSYELYKAKSIYSGKEDLAIRFNPTSSQPNKKSVISLRNDTLIIADNVYDGFKMEYISLKQHF